MTKLKSLEEYDEQKLDAYYKHLASQVRALTGVACPECGQELTKDLTSLLSSSPPLYKSKCSSCKYVGTMY